MKKICLSIVALFFLLSAFMIADENKFNGIMIDCSRLLEKHDYYYRLIDFMEEWEMNTLLLHFSDDHGLSIALPGYEKLAHQHAFTPIEIAALIEYARERKIDIIPELEIFGHTRYITDHPDYHHLYVGDRSDKIVFNAVDPLNPETIDLMKSLINEVAKLFPSYYMHLGCDEVNLSGLGTDNKTEQAKIWADYVNTMIGFVQEYGITPMIWSDHVRKDPGVADLLDKDIILVEWNYDPNYKPTGLEKFKSLGFKDIIMAPSISCWRNRVIPSRPQLNNVEAHASALEDGIAAGMLNTVWLPMRYLQESMWYGMAYGAWLVNSNKPMKLKRFHRAFTVKVFGLRLNNKLNRFLNNWTRLHLDRRFYSAIANNDFAILKDSSRIAELRTIKDLSFRIINKPINITPKKNPHILSSMYLSAEIMYVLSEGLLVIAENDANAERQELISRHLDSVIARAGTEWNRGRFPDDPAKYEARFPNQTNSHLLVVLRLLKEQLL